MAGTPVTTVLFTDLVGSTEILERLGDERAQRFFRGHRQFLRQVVTHHRGTLLQWQGDGVLATFGQAADALRCAVALHAGMAADPEGLRLRIGIDAAELLQDASCGFFGIGIVTARRLCDLAGAGEVLCGAGVVGLLAARPEFVFRARGAVALKGLAKRVPVYEFAPAGADV